MNLLRHAIDRLKASSFQSFEILVADDGSRLAEEVRAVAEQAGAKLVRLDRRSGPAAARNAAARNAAGDILVFMDADTSVHPDTLERFARKFRETPDLDAAMGSYDRHPTAPGVVSRFRNLLHSFVHRRFSRRATTFWAGCGAVRKHRFQTLGGFDESFSQPSIEDVEFGLRLHDAGGSIDLDAEIQVTHHKAWTLSSMVRTDFFARAVPWTLILHKHPIPLDLNFKAADRTSGALTFLTLLFTLVALLHGGEWWLAPMLCLAVIALLNWRLFRFLGHAAGWREAVLCFPLLLVYIATCVAGLITGLALAEHRRDRWLWPAAATIGVVLLMVQIFGGAFEAEFTGHPDEAAQFVSGLMVYDYLRAAAETTQLTGPDSITFTIRRLRSAIGRLDTTCWKVCGGFSLGPSRTTAMLLQWLIGVVTLTVLYRLCRPALSLPIAAVIIALIIAAPVFQESLEQAMADLCCLLWSVLVMQAAVRFVERRDQTALSLLVLWLLAAALTKGTAVCLAPVLLVALLTNRRPIRIPPRLLIAAASCLLAAGAWYLAMGGIGPGAACRSTYRGTAS